MGYAAAPVFVYADAEQKCAFRKFVFYLTLFQVRGILVTDRSTR